jgi:hypothetical protein
MGAAQIAKIRSALLDLVDAQEREHPDAANLCALLCVSDREDQWIQILLGTLNFGYPHADDPLEFLKRCGIAAIGKLTVTDFEANRYATLTYAPCAIDGLARFVDQLLIAIHALSPESYSLTVARDYLANGGVVSAQRVWYQAMPSRWASRAGPRGQNGDVSSEAAGLREPTLETDFWELASAEHRNRRSDGAFWIPPIEDRAALRHGDLAMLLFRMQTEDEDGVPEVPEERMWVLVTETPDHGRFLGRLINQPASVDSRSHYLTLGAEIPFRTEHVVEIHYWVRSDVDDFSANMLHRKWE